MSRESLPFFCDECGKLLSTGHACKRCKRVLCHKHHFGAMHGPLNRKDGLCIRCAAAAKKVSYEGTKQA